MTSIPTLIWLIELFNQLKEIAMDFLIGALLGAAAYYGVSTHVWPHVKAKRAIKARTAKAVATRRANAMRKAVEPQKGDEQ